MTAHLFPIKTALIIFPFLALFLLIPFLIFNYRKYGYVNKWRSFILYSLLLYLLTAYFLVILPMPDTFDTCSIQRVNTQHTQLVPFNFIQEIGHSTTVVLSQPSTYLNLLKESAFLQVAFNVLLTVPFGIYLRYYFRRSFLQTLFLSLCLSFFFEITQLTGLYGIYNCAYRLFDVDDLFLNTLGGAIGYMIAPLFTYFLPKSNELDIHMDLTSKPVGLIRRFVATQVDWLFLSFITPIFKINVNFFFFPSIQQYTNPFHLFLMVCVIVVYFIILPYFTNGVTLGKALLRIRIQGEHERVTFKELFVRYGLFYFVLGGINYISVSSFILNSESYLVIIGTLLFYITVNAIFAIHVVLHLFSQDKLLFYEHISHTKNIITFKKVRNNENG